MSAIRLTQYSHGAGCGCKIAPDVLDGILAKAGPAAGHKQLIVGNKGAARKSAGMSRPGIIACRSRGCGYSGDPWRRGIYLIDDDDLRRITLKQFVSTCATSIYALQDIEKWHDMKGFEH